MKKLSFYKKILRFGRYSHAVVLPKILMDALGWRERQHLEIIPDFKRGELIIKRAGKK
jgi:bifunctional DNA-binding transcriptional regulator/antitoxin component of YhaV-PrlF toxin-antitoxin module